MNGPPQWKGLDDWQVVCQFLPSGWEDAARTHGARGIVLRVLLVHLVDGCSLQETVLRADQAGWCSISHVAIFMRLRASERRMQWMAQRLWRSFPQSTHATGHRIRVVDATTVQEYGNTGTDWRVHFAMDLRTLHCDHFELTDITAETRWPDPSTGASSSGQKDLSTINALGQTLTSTDRNGTVHTLAYDVLGRITTDSGRRSPTIARSKGGRKRP